MHSLRHRFGSRAYRGTRNLRAVQVLLGHASIATTERYMAVDDAEIRAAMVAAIGNREALASARHPAWVAGRFRLGESKAGYPMRPSKTKSRFRGLRMNAKKAIAEATIAGTLAISALGLGPGVANANTPAPSNIPSVQWHQDDGGWWCWWWCWRPWHGPWR